MCKIHFILISMAAARLDRNSQRGVDCAQARSTERGLYAIRGRSGCLAHMRRLPVAISEDRACEIRSEVGKVASL